MKGFGTITIVLLAVAFMLSANVNADVPQQITYQGVLSDSTGAAVPDAPYLIKFIIWDDPTATGAGNEKWNSGFQTVNPVGGLFSYDLGSNVALPDDLFATDTSRWLGITVGTDPEMSPRTKLNSEAYSYEALRADTADHALTIANNSVKSQSIVDGTIVTADLSVGSVSTAKIQAGAVTNGKLGADAVTSSKILNGTITANDLATNSVGAAEIAAGAVGTSEVADNSLTANDLATNSVGAAEIAAGAVGSSEIASGAVFDIDVNASAAIGISKIFGTAVNLTTSQHITSNKRFLDSSMWISSIGVAIGRAAVTSTRLLQIERNYNTTGTRYGEYVNLDNSGTGILYGNYVDIDNNTSSGGSRYAYRGFSGSSSNTSGVSYGCRQSAYGGAGTSLFAVYGLVSGSSTNKYAGYFVGNVHVSGTLSKAAGSFKIDHPLDPANKYLVHSFVESPDMMNVYNGNVTTDGNGDAVVSLPDYFDALNKDFRYQLTSIGSPGPNLYISTEISGNQFAISGGEPYSKVSWQVTGVRKDAYAEAHRIKVEPDKPIAEKGLYLHPVELGFSETKQVHYEMHSKDELEREKNATAKPDQVAENN